MKTLYSAVNNPKLSLFLFFLFLPLIGTYFILGWLWHKLVKP